MRFQPFVELLYELDIRLRRRKAAVVQPDPYYAGPAGPALQGPERLVPVSLSLTANAPGEEMPIAAGEDALEVEDPRIPLPIVRIIVEINEMDGWKFMAAFGRYLFDRW